MPYGKGTYGRKMGRPKKKKREGMSASMKKRMSGAAERMLSGKRSK